MKNLLPIKGAHVKTVIVAAVGSGLLFAPGAFIFQVSQSWVSEFTQLPRDTFLWLTPTTLSACYILTVGLAYSLIVRRSRVHGSTTTSGQFRTAVIEYASSLAKAGRDDAILDLREGVGTLFHTQSANADRIKLGELAFGASLREHQTERQVAILVDDLGWANHMAGNGAKAVSHIDRAIEIVDMLPTDQLTNELRFLRSKAKRHKAVIESRHGLDQARGLLKEAEADILAAFPDRSRRQDIEIGQLEHAEALTISTYLNILDGKARIRPDDSIAQGLANEALVSVRESKDAFTRGLSLSKYAKALYLEHCLLNAIGREIEAREIKTLLDDTLSRSVWEVEGSQNNIRGG